MFFFFTYYTSIILVIKVRLTLYIIRKVVNSHYDINRKMSTQDIDDQFEFNIVNPTVRVALHCEAITKQTNDRQFMGKQRRIKIN